VGRAKQFKAQFLPAILKKINEKADKKVAAGCMPQGAIGCLSHESGSKPDPGERPKRR
jgi:hypothetical protein